MSQVYIFRDLQRVEEAEVEAGNIVAVAGIADVGIGETMADPNDPRPLPPITVEEPTVRMTFTVNDSPFAGREGQYRHQPPDLRARLLTGAGAQRGLRVEETGARQRVHRRRAAANCTWRS